MVEGNPAYSGKEMHGNSVWKDKPITLCQAGLVQRKKWVFTRQPTITLWVCLFPFSCLSSFQLCCLGTYPSDQVVMGGIEMAGYANGGYWFCLQSVCSIVSSPGYSSTMGGLSDIGAGGYAGESGTLGSPGYPDGAKPSY